jgi:branched-chain amino acid transport system permease protein
LALNAARWSEAGARTTGISVVQMKVIAGATAALVAGIGGALYEMGQTFQPGNFATLEGIIWLAVLVTIGVRSTAAALIAGVMLVFPDAIFQYYWPSVQNLPTYLAIGFGLGAISAAKYPDGVLAENGRRLRRLLLRFAPAGRQGPESFDGIGLDVGEVDAAPGVARVAEGVS